MKFFPTQLETYRNCPRKYACSKDPELKAKYAKSSPPLVLGNAVHDALHAFFDITKVPVSQRSYEKLCELFRQAWGGTGPFSRSLFKQREARQQAFGDDKAAEKSWGEKGLNVLYRFFHWERTARLLQSVPLTAEQFHDLWLAPDIELSGKIDRIDRDADGTLRILDWKTGKPPSGKAEQFLEKDDIQLAAYALIVSRKFRGKVGRCSYLYLDHEREVEIEPTVEYLAAKETEIRTLCGEILAAMKADRFPPTPNALCPWCDYREICPEGQAWIASHAAPAAEAADELPF